MGEDQSLLSQRMGRRALLMHPQGSSPLKAFRVDLKNIFNRLPAN